MITSCLPEDDLDPDSDDPRKNIAYIWYCEENSPTYGVQNYLVDISNDPFNSDQVILSNFYGLGNWSTTYATLSDDKLIINSQTVEGHSVSGEGIISSNYKTISWTYEVLEVNKTGKEMIARETVTATYTR